MILYYSGTGNSNYIAKKIALSTNDIFASMNERIKYANYQPIIVNGKLIIVTPTYCWRLPRIVVDYLKKAKLVKVSGLYFVMTCGSEIGNAEYYNKKLCQKLGFNYLGTCGLIMPENYLAMFNTPDKAKATKIINKVEEPLNELINHIEKGESLNRTRHNLYDMFLSSINPLFYKTYVKDHKFYVKDVCSSCGLCEKLCPLNNIELVNGKPKWLGNCTHCMACIAHCPLQAIEYGKSSKGRNRYYI